MIDPKIGGERYVEIEALYKDIRSSQRNTRKLIRDQQKLLASGFLVCGVLCCCLIVTVMGFVSAIKVLIPVALASIAFVVGFKISANKNSEKIKQGILYSEQKYEKIKKIM